MSYWSPEERLFIAVCRQAHRDAQNGRLQAEERQEAEAFLEWLQGVLEG